MPASHRGGAAPPGVATRLAAALVALAGLLLGASPAAAAEVEAKVASVRGRKVYLELKTPLELRVGARVAVRPPGQGAEVVRTVVAAVSTRYLVVEVAEGVVVTPGQALRVVVDGAPAPAPRAAPAAPAAGAVKVGRPRATAEDYQRQQAPARELVPFRRVARGDAPPPRPAGGPAPRAGPRPDDAEAPPDGERANEVSGEVEAGVDYVSDDGVDVGRTTPFARLALEVDRLGGSDRTRLLFYGSVRQPIDGEWDLTGRNKDELIADITALALEVDARPEEEVQSFTDRVELKIGRTLVPAMVEAGLIDGAELGLRFGSITAFGYAGAGASPNPEHTDYDTIVYGGGLRFERSFTHTGALRLSLGGGQQRFRGEGERDFLESQLDARLGAFGIRGGLVVDFYDALVDRREVRLTTGLLRVTWQVTSHVRLEAGWSERRQQFQTAFVRDLDPVSLAAIDHDEPRTTYDALALLTAGAFDLTARGLVYDGGRSAYAGGLTLGKNDTFVRDRLALDVLVTHRRRGGSLLEHSTDPYVSLGYTVYGEVVVVQLAAFYRATLPDDTGDERFGGRASVDITLPAGLALRAWGEVESRRADDDRGEAFLLGTALRWRF